MKIHRIEFTHIPQCQKGRQFADEFVEHLKEQGAFRERKDSTQFINIRAEYSFELKEEKEEQK